MLICWSNDNLGGQPVTRKRTRNRTTANWREIEAMPVNYVLCTLKLQAALARILVTSTLLSRAWLYFRFLKQQNRERDDQEEDQTADKGKYSKLSNTSTWPLTRLRKDYFEFSRPFGSTVGLRPISKAICPLRQRQVEVCRRKTQLIDLQTKTGTNVKSNEIQKEKSTW